MVMNKLALILAALALFGCEEKQKAPEIGNIEKIVIEGNEYSAKRYLDTFCGFPKAVEEDKNCIMAKKQANKELSEYKKIIW